MLVGVDQLPKQDLIQAIAQGCTYLTLGYDTYLIIERLDEGVTGCCTSVGFPAQGSGQQVQAIALGL